MSTDQGLPLGPWHYELVARAAIHERVLWSTRSRRSFCFSVSAEALCCQHQSRERVAQGKILGAIVRPLPQKV